MLLTKRDHERTMTEHNNADDAADQEQAIQMLADSLKEHVRTCDGYDEPDKSFGLAVTESLIREEAWSELHWTIENAVSEGRLGPIGVADLHGVTPDPDDREAADCVASDIQYAYEEEIVSRGGDDEYGPVCEEPEYEEPDKSFAIAVVRKLAGRGEWGAIHFTAENAMGMNGLGPVAVAWEEGVDPDPSDTKAVEQVADAIAAGYGDFPDDDDMYGPDASDGDEKSADEYRLNDGKYDHDHKIFHEMDRLHEAGANISSWMIVRTDYHQHPDYLQVEYHGVSANTMEDLRYRHIRRTDYGALASRPLSEIETREGDDR